MTKKILIIKNITREGPGLIENVLKENNVEYDIIDLDKGENIPDVNDYASLIVMGGPDSANDKTEKINVELEKINNAINSNIPYFGVCLGMQTLVKAMNGEVIKNEIKEVGFKDTEGNNFEIMLTEKGKSDPIFAGLNTKLKIFHLHGETVKLTENMELLAKGKFCENQFVKVGSNAYGIQGHLELTEEMLNKWLEEDPDLKLLDKETIKSDYNDIKEEYGENCKKLIDNFLIISNSVKNNVIEVKQK